MKRYIVCLAVLLTACTSEVEHQDVPPQDVSESPSATGSPTVGSYTSPCDRPTRYEDITVDSRTYTLPIFVMCDPHASDRDLGDPPPIEVAKTYQIVSNPAPIQR